MATQPQDAHKWERYLRQHCHDYGLPTPSFEVGSDRRGGRTGWTAWVVINDQTYKARFSYNDVVNAREDASERALQELGVIPKPPPLANSPTPEQEALLRRMVEGTSNVKDEGGA